MKHKKIELLPRRPLGFRYVGRGAYLINNYVVPSCLVPGIKLNLVGLTTSLSLQPKPEPLTGWRKFYDFIFDRNRFFRNA